MDSIPRPKLLAGHHGMLMQLPPHFYPPRDPNFRSDREHLSDLEHKLSVARQRVNFLLCLAIFLQELIVSERESEREIKDDPHRKIGWCEWEILHPLAYRNPSLTRVQGLSDVRGCWIGFKHDDAWHDCVKLRKLIQSCCLGIAVSGSQGREAVCQLDEGIYILYCARVCVCKIAGSPDDICHRRILLSSFW